MPSSRYLVRFDDICPTMNWGVWEQVEQILLDHDVLPLLAVVPANEDPDLMVDAPEPGFWDRVRSWQARNWSIAMHGYQHRYETHSSGLLRINSYSEFAGLPRDVQRTKLANGMAVFREHGIRADAFVAPAHSFDRQTVSLLPEVGIALLSDGLARTPFRSSAGVLWVPQQLWHFAERRTGIWTVCLHHNAWKADDLSRFANALASYRQSMTDLSTVAAEYGSRRETPGDRLYARLWHTRCFSRWRCARAVARVMCA